jgi:hypothetical protein
MSRTLIDKEIALCRTELQRMNLGVHGLSDSPPPNSPRNDRAYRPLHWDGRLDKADIAHGKAIIQVLMTNLTLKHNSNQYLWRKTPTVPEWDWFCNEEKLGSAKIGERGTVDLSYTAINGRPRTTRLRNKREAEDEVPIMLRSVGIEAAPEPRRRRSASREPRRRRSASPGPRKTGRDASASGHFGCADTGSILQILKRKFESKGGYTYKETMDNGMLFSVWRSTGSGRKAADAFAIDCGVYFHIYRPGQAREDHLLQTTEDADAIAI